MMKQAGISDYIRSSLLGAALGGGAGGVTGYSLGNVSRDHTISSQEGVNYLLKYIKDHHRLPQTSEEAEERAEIARNAGKELPVDFGLSGAGMGAAIGGVSGLGYQAIKDLLFANETEA